MEEYTREQIQRADDTDLYVFLSGRGEQFKRCGKVLFGKLNAAFSVRLKRVFQST